MNRLTLIGWSVLLALVLLLGYATYTGIGERAVLQAANEALTEASARAVEREKSDRQVLVARQAEIAAKQRELKQVQEALSEALQRNKAWSDTDVPDEVQSALGGAPSGLAGVLPTAPPAVRP